METLRKDEGKENQRSNKEEFEHSKTALIRIYEILRDYSDRDHPLTQQDIIDKLESEYNLSMERRAVRRNLFWL